MSLAYPGKATSSHPPYHHPWQHFGRNSPSVLQGKGQTLHPGATRPPNLVAVSWFFFYYRSERQKMQLLNSRIKNSSSLLSHQFTCYHLFPSHNHFPEKHFWYGQHENEFSSRNQQMEFEQPTIQLHIQTKTEIKLKAKTKSPAQKGKCLQII